MPPLIPLGGTGKIWFCDGGQGAVEHRSGEGDRQRLGLGTGPHPTVEKVQRGHGFLV